MVVEQAASVSRPGLARNALNLGIGQVLTTALTIMLAAAVARTLGATEFGLLYLITSIATFSYVFVDWGHGPYVTREIARKPERSGELMGSVLVVRVCTALIMCLLATGLTWALGYDLRTRLFAGVLILAWVPQFLGLTYAWAFRGRERMEYDALIQVVLKFTTLIAALICLGLGGRVLALMSTYAISGSITFITAVAIYRHLGFPPLHFSATTARELIRDGAPMLAISLAIAIQPYIDANLLYKLAPPSVVGWYGAAWAIAGTLVAPATILGAAMYPRLSRVADDRSEFSHTLRTAFRPLVLVACLGATGTFLFADFAVGVIYSQEKFGPAASILKAFTPALILIYIDMILGYSILAVGKATQLAKAKVIAVVVTTAVELALIPMFQVRFSNGGMGIVLALACGELVMVTAAILLIRDLVDGRMLLDAARGLFGGMATVILIRLLPPMTPLLAIPLCIATFAIVATAAGLLRREDAALIASIFNRRVKLAPENTQT